MVSKLEWSMIDGAINKCQQAYQLDTPSKAFSYYVLELMFPDANENLEDLITDGGNDCGIDAIKISKLDGCADVHFFQFKYRATHENSRKYFPGDAVDKVIAFFKALFDEDATLEKSCNPFLWQKVQEIWSSIRDSSTRFTLHFGTNGLNLEPAQKVRLINGIREYKITFHEIDDAVLCDLIVNSHSKETVHHLTAVDKQYYERSDGDIRGLIATVNAKELVNVIADDAVPSRVDGRNFDQNIRVYLGGNNPVNEAIIQSALSRTNSYFWYLNNGITAVCSAFSYQPGARSPKIEIKNLQIVNGSQTSHALFEAARSNPEALDNVLVLVRLYETKNTELPHEIAVATNSQTRIYHRDLTSNSTLQLQLEKAFASLGYFYERKKNQHKDKPDDKRIDAFKLGQAILAYHLKEPEKAKTDSDKIFGNRYNEIFSSELNVNHLLNIYKTFCEIEALRADTNISIKKGTVVQADTFLTYGQFHILYLVSILAEKSRSDISKVHNRQRLVKDALSVVRNFVSDRKSYAFYNLFRHPKTKQDLYDLVFQRGQLELQLFETEKMKAG